jgi:hypothetical protein
MTKLMNPKRDAIRPGTRYLNSSLQGQTSEVLLGAGQILTLAKQNAEEPLMYILTTMNRNTVRRTLARSRDWVTAVRS